MATPSATDTGSLAFNSAVFCRLSVMLVYNVDLLVLPTESDGLATTQTRFYCRFGRKARLAILGKDYYLLLVPLLLLLLFLALYLEVLSKARSRVARLLHTPQITRFQWGRTAIPWHEDKVCPRPTPIPPPPRPHAHTSPGA